MILKMSFKPVSERVKDIKVSEMIKQFSRFEIRDIDVAIN